MLFNWERYRDFKIHLSSIEIVSKHFAVKPLFGSGSAKRSGMFLSNLKPPKDSTQFFLFINLSSLTLSMCTRTQFPNPTDKYASKLLSRSTF